MLNFIKECTELVNMGLTTKFSRETDLPSNEDKVKVEVRQDDSGESYISVNLEDVEAHFFDDMEGYTKITQINIYNNIAKFINNRAERDDNSVYEYHIEDKFINIIDENSESSEQEVIIKIYDFPKFLKCDPQYLNPSDFPIIITEDIECGQVIKISAYLNPSMLIPVVIGYVSDKDQAIMYSKLSYMVTRIKNGSNNLLGFYKNGYFIIDNTIYQIQEFGAESLLVKNLVSDSIVKIKYCDILMNDKNIRFFDDNSIVIKAENKDVFELCHINTYIKDQLKLVNLSIDYFINKFASIYNNLPSVTAINKLLSESIDYIKLIASNVTLTETEYNTVKEYMSKIDDYHSRITSSLIEYDSLVKHVANILVIKNNEIETFDVMYMYHLTELDRNMMELKDVYTKKIKENSVEENTSSNNTEE